MRRVVAVCSLAVACGRVGFDPAADGGTTVDGDGGVVPPDRIALHVIADVTRAPIAGAAVLVDRGGSVDRVATDPNGIAMITTTSAVDLAVVFQAAGGWRVYSVRSVPPGTAVGLGGRNPNATATSMMTVASPATSATMYGLTLPDACGNGLIHYGGSTMAIAYVPSCEGTSYHLWTFATPSSGNLDAIDAGTLTLASGTTKTVQGTWTPVASTTLQVTNVPATASGVVATLGLADTNGFMPTSELANAVIAGTNATATLHSPSANTLELGVPSTAALPYGGASSLIVPAMPVPSLAIDATTMLPHVTQLSLPPAANAASWTLGPATIAATASAFEASVTSSTPIEWTVLAPGDTTAVTFPALPADLAAADPSGGTWNMAVATELAIPGATYQAALADLDATWLLADGAISRPPGATATSDILYESALGPP